MCIELCECIYKRSNCHHCQSNHIYSIQWIVQLEINKIKTITINSYWIHCRIHVMAGMKPDNCNEAEMESTYIKNVTMAAKKFQPVCAHISLSLSNITILLHLHVYYKHYHTNVMWIFGKVLMLFLCLWKFPDSFDRRE